MKQLSPRDPVKLLYFTGIKNPFNVRFAIALAVSFITIFAVSANILMKPGVAKAAIGPYYSISHYLNFDNETDTSNALYYWARQDANRADPVGGSCPSGYYSHNVIAVLDFGSPEQNGSQGYGFSNWGPTLDGRYSVWYYMPDVGNLVTQYAENYYNFAGVCSHLTVAIGTSNSYECGFYGMGQNSTCITNEGFTLGATVDGAESNLHTYASQSGGNADILYQVNIAGGDDIEDGGGFDTYNQTQYFMQGFTQYNSNRSTGYYLWDYGAAFPCGNGCDNGNTISWDDGELYKAAWGYGWDMPLPEAYNPVSLADAFGDDWGQVYANTKNGCSDCTVNGHFAGAMQFYGNMTDYGWNDPSSLWWNFFNTGERDYGLPWPGSYIFDTCLPTLTWNSQSASPCY